MVILDPSLGPSTSELELHKVDAATWIIRNHGIPATDPAHVVACVTDRVASGVDVLWLVPTGLPTYFASASAVIDALRQRRSSNSRRTRPVPIPHLPPGNRRPR
ncbi:hypothetical protein [Microbacterium sp. NPDC056569]|uniref:hypothetical protein n=1 Tax=Microbacterium sp. NPDC056569 TaxID=3345867 RepID=UPI003670CEE0